jgi:hypothetical protein
MSLKQFVWNLTGAESEIPEDELPDETDETQVQPGDMAAANATRMQDDADPAGIPNVDIDVEDDVNGSFGSFLTTLVAGVGDESPTPKVASPPTPKQEQSFFGSMFGGASSNEVVESVEPTTPPQSTSFIGSIFGGGAAETASAVEPLTPNQNASFIGSLFGSADEGKPEDVIVVDEPEPQSFLGSLFGSRAPSPEAAIPGEKKAEEDPPAPTEAAIEGGETANFPANYEPPEPAEQDAEPQSFFGTLFGGKPGETEQATQDQPDQVAPEEPQSFIGSFFGSRPASPNPESEEKETFFGSLFGGGEAQEEPLTPPQPSSPQAETTPVVADTAPTSPVSFFGSLLGGPSGARPVVAASDEPLPEDIESEEEEGQGGGFGSFLAGLVTGGSAEPDPGKERRSSKLGELADELVSPSATVKTPPIQKLAQEATAFNDTEADDLVDQIEKLGEYIPKSKQFMRLIVENETDAQLKLGEAEVAMALLRRMQKETDETYSKPTRVTSNKPIVENLPKEPTKTGLVSSVPKAVLTEPQVAKKVVVPRGKSSSAPPPKKEEGWNIFGFSGNTAPKADVPKLTLPGSDAETAKLEKVSKEALEHATALLKKTGPQRQIPLVSKILHRAKGAKKSLPSPHRAQHSFEPVSSSFSTRFSQINTDSSTVSPTDPIGRPSVIVTSIEARTVHRSHDAWEF